MFPFSPPPVMDRESVKKEVEITAAIAEMLTDAILNSKVPEEHKNAVRLINESRLLSDTVSKAIEKLIMRESVDPVKVTQALEYIKLIHANIETFFVALEKSETENPKNM